MPTEDSCLADEMFRRVIAIVNLLMSAPEGLSVADIAHAVGAAPSIVRGDLPGWPSMVELFGELGI